MVSKSTGDSYVDYVMDFLSSFFCFENLSFSKKRSSKSHFNRQLSASLQMRNEKTLYLF